MIPLRDSVPARSWPVVTWALIGANLWVFLYEALLGPGLEAFIRTWGSSPRATFSSPRPTPATGWASVLAVLDRKKPEDIDDQTLILADVSRKAITQLRRTVRDLLGERMAPEQAAALAEKLATGTWTHDYPITAEEAKALGLPVSTEMPEEVFQFMNLFPQPTRTRPAVEYVPMPYRTRQGRALSDG